MTWGKAEQKLVEKASAAAAKAAVAEAMLKGKGKGGKGVASAKGKSKGKGHAATVKEGAKLKEGQWLCLNHVCKFAVARIPNPPGSRRCTNNECCLPKSEAMNPKLNERVRPAQPASSAKSAQVQAAADAAREKSKAAAKAEEANKSGQVAIPVLPVQVTPLSIPAVKEAVKLTKAAERKVAFTQQQADSFSNITPALAAVLESLAREKRPEPWSGSREAQKTADSFLKDSTHVSRCAELAEAEENLQNLQSALGHLKPTSPTYKALTTEMETAQALVGKLQKTLPSPSLQTSCFEEVKAAYRRHCQTRKDRSAKGKAAAEERKEFRREQIRLLRSELDMFEDTLEELQQDLENDYEQLTIHLERFDEEVLEILQKGRNDGAETHNMDTEADPLVAQLNRDKALAEEKVRQAEEQARERVRKAEEELNKAKAETQEAKAEAEAMKKKAEEALHAAGKKKNTTDPKEEAEAFDLDDALELDPELVPELEVPKGQKGLTEGAAANFEQAYQVLQQIRWMPNVQLAFQVLCISIDDVQTLVGEQWDRVYEEQPKAEDVAHPQILRLLHVALEKLSAKHLASRSADEKQEACRKAREALREQAKRQRTN